MGKISVSNVLIILLLSATCALEFSCHDKLNCRGAVGDAFFRFQLVDKYGNNLIAKWGAKYLSDSVFMVRSDGLLPHDLNIETDGYISLVIRDDDHEADDSIVTRQYYLYLPDNQGHPKADVDTLTFMYQSERACYESFKVMFNDSLYYDGEFTYFIRFTKD